MRQPLGIEQYELDGRPDGREPFGRPTMLDEIRARLESHRGAHGSDEGFAISHDDFTALQSEGLLFYFRYLVLFQIGDFVRTSRDTEHNLAALRPGGALRRERGRPQGAAAAPARTSCG